MNAFPRQFDCRKCGARVVVDDIHDRRTVFCSPYCEREFWRHKARYERRKDIWGGHVTRLSVERSENRREAGL